MPPGYRIEVIGGAGEVTYTPPVGVGEDEDGAGDVGAAGATAGDDAPRGAAVTGAAATASSSSAAAAAPPARTGPAGSGPLDYDDAIQYVEKIKHRFASDKRTYDSFLKVLFSYQNQLCSIKDVVLRVTELFRDHPDLLRDFTFFLPDAQLEVESVSRRAASAAPPPPHAWLAAPGRRQILPPHPRLAPPRAAQ